MKIYSDEDINNKESVMNETILLEDIKDMLNGVGRVVMYYVHNDNVANPKDREV